MSGLSVSDVVEWLKYIYIYDVFFVSSLLPLNWHIAAIKKHTHTLTCEIFTNWFLYSLVLMLLLWLLVFINNPSLHAKFNQLHTIFLWWFFFCVFLFFLFRRICFESKIQLAGFWWLAVVYLFIGSCIQEKKKNMYIMTL